MVLTEERLDELEGRFKGNRVRELTGCRFEDYIRHPETTDRLTRRLAAINAVQCAASERRPRRLDAV
jgi:hypothetical protein